MSLFAFGIKIVAFTQRENAPPPQLPLDKCQLINSHNPAPLQRTKICQRTLDFLVFTIPILGWYIAYRKNISQNTLSMGIPRSLWAPDLQSKQSSLLYIGSNGHGSGTPTHLMHVNGSNCLALPCTLVLLMLASNSRNAGILKIWSLELEVVTQLPISESNIEKGLDQKSIAIEKTEIVLSF